MKKVLKKVIAIIVVATILLSTIPVFANFTTAALISNSAEGYNWMSYIKDSTKLSDISIPGSHDSGSISPDAITSAWSKTQNLTISEQLNAGVRFLDLRLRYNTAVDTTVQVVHGSVALYDDNGNALTIGYVISTLYTFLTYYPSETVIVSFKEDDGNNEYEIVKVINSYISKNPNLWYQSYGTPTLEQVRGKIVVATRMSSMRGLELSSNDQGQDGGYTYDQFKNLYFQDRYNMGTENKWENAARPLLDMTKPSGAWSINYMSTTGANINGVSSNANIMNQHFNKYGASNNKCYGIVVFDYVSDGLCKKVFKCNDLVAKNQPNPKEGQYYYRLNWNVNDPVTGGWSGMYVKINYRKNNGTGTSSSVLLFDPSDTYNGYQFVCNAENFDFSGWLPGYPTSVEFFYDFGYGARTLDVNQRLYVGKSPTSALTLVAKNDFRNSSYISTPCRGTEFYNVSPMPTPSSVVISDSSDKYVDVPRRNSSSYVTVPVDCEVLDQYGVNWYDNNYSLSLDKEYTGVRVNGKSIMIDQAANALKDGTDIYVTAKYAHSSGTATSSVKKRIVLNVSSLQYKFVNYDGTILEEGWGYNGDIPEYTGSTPEKPATKTHHYTFTGFSNNTGLSETNNVYTAQYNEVEHNFNRTIVPIPATCSQEGAQFDICDCGYSVETTLQKLNHELFIDRKEPTCTEDGYARARCKNCTFIETEVTYDATGHDIENAKEGEHVGASSECNGYIPYYCPICEDEIVELRQYDDTDWSTYLSVVKKYQDILTDPAYLNVTATMRMIFETQIDAQIKKISEKDKAKVTQADLDNACQSILTTIENFSNAFNINFYTINFVFADGRIEEKTYSENTKAEDIVIPDNTENVITDEEHTIFRWEAVEDVTQNATYNEIITTAQHTYEISSTVELTCTTNSSVTYSCECGHTYTNTTGHALGHYYMFETTNDGNVQYGCKYCDENTHITKEHLVDMWDMSYYNTTDIDRAGVDNSNITSMLDMNSDGIINAKDYAIILHQ